MGWVFLAAVLYVLFMPGLFELSMVIAGAYLVWLAATFPKRGR